ncbi:hypothetical protein EDD18DRAFT_1463253 [Armillaria luteobubalina]|uniref:Uncharacterized protein n=1 Tax=Armillaria luteobubalina TaxID=153913 RepID=A0AA39Q4H9_9AGAR|nr:hypothetical protein EDD18DRAFT_1463253 [Armillaria luteobubalina]
MATQTDIPPDLTSDDKVLMSQSLDSALNAIILYAQLHGIYTGIFAVSLWNICDPGAFLLRIQADVNGIDINKCRSIRRATIVIIILLYAFITTNFAATWSYLYFAFINNGDNIWTVFLKFEVPQQAFTWEMGLSSLISTVFADLYIIWCCWIVWGQRWPVVLLPILSLVSVIVSRIMEMYLKDINSPVIIVFNLLYISFTLTTTLSCTLLIIYRIATIVGIGYRAEGRLTVYHRFLEVLVESSALYSICLILNLAFTIHNNFAWSHYLDVTTGIAKGIAPTLLIGRAAAGHTRPQDESDGSASTVSSIHFQVDSEVGTTSSIGSTAEIVAPGFATDIEVQHE